MRILVHLRCPKPIDENSGALRKSFPLLTYWPRAETCKNRFCHGLAAVTNAQQKEREQTSQNTNNPCLRSQAWVSKPNNSTLLSSSRNDYNHTLSLIILNLLQNALPKGKEGGGGRRSISLKPWFPNSINKNESSKPQVKRYQAQWKLSISLYREIVTFLSAVKKPSQVTGASWVIKAKREREKKKKRPKNPVLLTRQSSSSSLYLHFYVDKCKCMLNCWQHLKYQNIYCIWNTVKCSRSIG